MVNTIFPHIVTEPSARPAITSWRGHRLNIRAEKSKTHTGGYQKLYFPRNLSLLHLRLTMNLNVSFV